MDPLTPPSGHPFSIHILSALSDPPLPGGTTHLHHVPPLFPPHRDPYGPQGLAQQDAHPGTDKDEVLALCPILLLLKHDTQFVLDTLGLNELAD